MSAHKQALPKRIIICCDGTWQSAVDGKQNIPSNVTRLARCLERVGVDKDGKEWQQVVWYDSGVGTTSGYLGRKLEGAVGEGLEGNVIEAYNFCVLNYSKGDQIMCFGFSRGAYTARAIAGVISDIGVCKPDALQHFHEIWKLYKENDMKTGRFWGSPEYYDFIYGVEADPELQPEGVNENSPDEEKIWVSEPHRDWELYEDASREIEVVGVYDTVGALGMPSVMGYQPKLAFGPDKRGYHNVKLSPNIKNAFQALAIDEHRKAFSPTVWHLPPQTYTADAILRKQEVQALALQKEWDDVRNKKEVPKKVRDDLKKNYQTAWTDLLRARESNRKPSKLLQVWFPGVHINIGGGSSDTLKGIGDLEELSNMTFCWMLDQISQYVTIDKKAYLDEARDQFEEIKKYNLKAEANRKRIALEKQRGWGQYLLDGLKFAANKVMHPLTPGPSTDVRHRVQDWGTGEIIESYTAMYYLNGSFRRVPGNYTKDNNNMPELGNTEEYIHPSIGYRIAMSKDEPDKKKRYRPAAFAEEDFVRRLAKPGEGDGTGFVYDVKGSNKYITEYVLPAAPADATEEDLPYERFAVLGERAQKYVDELDKHYNFPKQMMGNPPSFLHPRKREAKKNYLNQRVGIVINE